MLVLVGEAYIVALLEMNDYSEYHHLIYENTTNQFKTPEDNLHLLRWRDVCVWCHSGELARWKRDQLSDIWHSGVGAWCVCMVSQWGARKVEAGSTE